MLFKSLTATLSAGALFLGLALPTAAIASPVVRVGVSTSHHSHIVARPMVTTRQVWVAGYYTVGHHGYRTWNPGYYKTVRVTQPRPVVVHTRPVRPRVHVTF